MHLGGVIIVSGWVDPVVQQSMDTHVRTVARHHHRRRQGRIDGLYDDCAAAVAAQTPSSAAANDACGKIKSAIEEISGLYLLNIGARPATHPRSR